MSFIIVLIAISFAISLFFILNIRSSLSRIKNVFQHSQCGSRDPEPSMKFIDWDVHHTIGEKFHV